MAPKKVAASGAGDKADRSIWVVLLCGLPGSGKSTLRHKLVKNGWAYVSQDEMQTSDACEKALVKAMKNGQSCVVDRCNVTPSERRLWMQHANRAVEKGVVKGVKLHFEAVWMATPPHVCKERARSRTGHETLRPEAADEVIDSFCRGLKPPERSGQEPYEGVHIVVCADDVDLVVRRFANPAQADSSVQLAPPSQALAAAAAAAAAATADAGAVLAPGAGEAAADAEGHGDVAAGIELFIVRHGERADKARMHDDGWPDDPPLTKDGRETAKRAGAALRELASLPWAPAVYCSPYYRCLQTANELAAELGLPVRVEPGLSELCIERIFSEQPRLRPPEEALAAALQRTEVDVSIVPVAVCPPAWPEQPRAANERVLRTARALVARHPGRAVCLVCHCHGLVELTRHLPKVGGGAVGSQADYCAMTHIDAGGRLQRALDQSYLKHAASSSCRVEHSSMEVAAAGCWEEAWLWRGAGDAQGRIQVDDLLDMDLGEALLLYPAFNRLFMRGDVDKQSAWRSGWDRRCPDLRRRLGEACDSGIFRSDALR